MKKPTVGQKIFLKPVSNAARYYDPDGLIGTVVTSVGRKYFSVECTAHNGGKPNRFNLEDWIHDNGGYSPYFKVYETEQEFMDEYESSVLAQQIWETFHYGSKKKLSLEQLREISKIIGDEK